MKLVKTEKGVKSKLSKQGRSAKRKGGQYERYLAKKFQEKYGVELKRTPQSGGFAKKSEKADDFRGDITIVDPKQVLLLHIEAKSHKTISMHKWLNQAEEDCPNGRTPIVIFHEYGTSNDYVTLDYTKFIKLIGGSKDSLFHVFKTRKTWTLVNWLHETESLCPKDKIPVLVVKKTEEPSESSYAVISLDDFLNLVPKKEVIGKRVFRWLYYLYC